MYTGDLRQLVWDQWTDKSSDPYIYCFKHNDKRRPSMRVYPDGAHCFTCGAHVFRKEFLEHFTEEELTSAKLVFSRNIRGPAKPTIPLRVQMEFSHRMLLTRPEKRQWLYDRGITDTTIQEMQLGHNGPAYTLPVFSPAGELIGLRFRRDDSENPDADKYWGVKGQPPVQVYWTKPLNYDKVFIMTEGEFDALLLRQEGLPVFSLTNGCLAGLKNLSWLDSFPNLGKLVLCGDQDVAGRQAMARYQSALPVATTIIEWSGGTKDITQLWQDDRPHYHDIVEQLRRECGV